MNFCVLFRRYRRSALHNELFKVRKLHRRTSEIYGRQKLSVCI